MNKHYTTISLKMPISKTIIFLICIYYVNSMKYIKRKCRINAPTNISSLPADSVILMDEGSITLDLLCNNSKINKLEYGSFKINKKIIVNVNLRYNYLSELRMYGALLNLNLKELNLMNNNFTAIKAGYFEQLKFKILKLGNNNISSIDSSSFTSNSELSEIHMQNNKLTSLPEFIFENNIKLKIINFDNNLINTILGSWDNLMSLNQIKLNENNLTTFYEGIFKREYTIFEIKNNDFKCSCDILWALNFKFNQVLDELKHEKCKRIDYGKSLTLFDILENGNSKHEIAKEFLTNLTCINGTEPGTEPVTINLNTTTMPLPTSSTLIRSSTPSSNMSLPIQPTTPSTKPPSPSTTPPTNSMKSSKQLTTTTPPLNSRNNGDTNSSLHSTTASTSTNFNATNSRQPQGVTAFNESTMSSNHNNNLPMKSKSSNGIYIILACSVLFIGFIGIGVFKYYYKRT